MNPLLRIKPARYAVPIVKKWRSSRVDRISHESTIEIKYHNFYNKADTTLKYWYRLCARFAENYYSDLIKKQGFKFGSIKLWNGSLFEFNTHQNDLYFPDFNSIKVVKTKGLK